MEFNLNVDDVIVLSVMILALALEQPICSTARLHADEVGSTDQPANEFIPTTDEAGPPVVNEVAVSDGQPLSVQVSERLDQILSVLLDSNEKLKVIATNTSH